MNRITSKKEFFARSQKLEFGNRLRQWTYPKYCVLLEEVPEEVPYRVSVRGGSAASTRIQAYALDPLKAKMHCESVLSRGYAEEDEIYLDETAPDSHVVLQAEVMNDENFYYMRYALHSGIRMRQAYEIMKHVYGSRAIRILREYLDEESWMNLITILQEFPESVVELSSYSFRLGVLNWNTLFWEVRNY